MNSCSIIICTRNRAKFLRFTLEHFRDIEVPAGLDVELLVVDNGSSDDTAQVVDACRLENLPVRRIYVAEKGLSKARNAGIAKATGSIILFTDDDVIPSRHWIAGMCTPILSGEADAVAGGVVIAPHLIRPWMQPMHRSMMCETTRLTGSAPLELVGANCAFSRRVLEKVPAFDEELGAGAIGFAEESLFSWQISRAGFRIVTALDVTVEHHFDADRLLRKHFIAAARARGSADGYLRWHWKHEPVGWDWLYLIKRSLRLAWWRLLRRPWRQKEGAPQWELELVHNVAGVGYLLREALTQQPRKYQRLGLVKNSGKKVLSEAAHQVYA